MPHYFATYDIKSVPSDPHSKVRSEASSFGWYTFETDYQGDHSKLPNTCIEGQFDNLLHAQQRFHALINEARHLSSDGLILEKHIIMEIGEYIFVSDELVRKL